MRLLSSSIIIFQAFFLIWWTHFLLCLQLPSEKYVFWPNSRYSAKSGQTLHDFPIQSFENKAFSYESIVFSPIKNGQFQPYFQRCCVLEVVNILIGLNRHRITTFSRAKLNRQTCRKERKIETKGDRPKQPHSAQVSQRRTWINNIQTQTHTSNFFQYIKWRAHRRIEIQEQQHKRTHTHTHAEFPCQCLRRGIGCVAARDQSDWFWPDFSHLSLVLFWMNTALEQTPPCAAFFFFFLKNAPFHFLHLLTPSAVYHLLQEALLVPSFVFRPFFSCCVCHH